MRHSVNDVRWFSFSFLIVMCCIAASAQEPVLKERLLILNEGLWQSNNARISYFEDGQVISDRWFEEANGYGIGDTPNDIIQVGENLIAIAVNGSNIIQYVNTDGMAVAATEDVPNNRRLATDGEYLYVTSYAHECSTADGLWQCTKGFVAKIDLATFQVVKCCEVGYEPEGIACYNGCLFVANTGGYSYEGHDYESTVSIIDSETMTKIRDVDTGVINLYGNMSQTGRYLCINSAGDYFERPACSLVMDCCKAIAGNDECFIVIDGVPATYNCATTDGRFIAIGSSFNYVTYDYDISTALIDPEIIFDTNGVEGLGDCLPGTVSDDIRTMVASPYGIYVNPYSGYIYVADASDYCSPGKLHQWTPQGCYAGSFTVYINPGHFLALGDWTPTGIAPVSGISTGSIWNLQGMEVPPTAAGILITNGRKYISR